MVERGGQSGLLGMGNRFAFGVIDGSQPQALSKLLAKDLLMLNLS